MSVEHNNQKHSRKKCSSGFSIIDLAIIITVLAVIIAGSLSYGVGKLEIEKINTDADKMQVVDTAIKDFVRNNPANGLPCPAQPLALNTMNYSNVFGTSDCAYIPASFTLNGNIRVGAIPVKTLNLPIEYALDKWGNYITYVMDNDLAGANFSINDSNLIVVTETTAGRLRQIRVPYLIIHHGKQGYGAFTGIDTRISGTTQFNVTNPDIIENIGCGGGWDATNTEPDCTNFDGVFRKRSPDNFGELVNATQKFDMMIYHVSAKEEVLGAKVNPGSPYDPGTWDSCDPACDPGCEDCIMDMCVSNCPMGQVCSGSMCTGGGSCSPACSACETCNMGMCEDNCPMGQTCNIGTGLCEGGGSCSPACSACETCNMGMCEDNCPMGQTCNIGTGLCEGGGSCSPACSACETCNMGMCEDNCPMGQTCNIGTGMCEGGGGAANGSMCFASSECMSSCCDTSTSECATADGTIVCESCQMHGNCADGEVCIANAECFSLCCDSMSFTCGFGMGGCLP